MLVLFHDFSFWKVFSNLNQILHKLGNWGWQVICLRKQNMSQRDLGVSISFWGKFLPPLGQLEISFITATAPATFDKVLLLLEGALCYLVSPISSILDTLTGRGSPRFRLLSAPDFCSPFAEENRDWIWHFWLPSVCPPFHEMWSEFTGKAVLQEACLNSMHGAPLSKHR